MSWTTTRATRSARLALHVLAFAVCVAPALGAQQSCPIEETKPNQIRDAFLMLQRVGKDSLRAAADLKSAVKLLTDNPDKIKNPSGRALELGRALALWMQQPGIGYKATRAQLGWVGNPTETVDLVATTDSLMREVGQVAGCEKTAQSLRAATPWTAAANNAIQQFNAGHADSAIALATIANRLWSGQPYGSLVLGNVAQQRGQIDEALRQFDLSQRAGLTDTSFLETRRQVLLVMGNVAAAAADSATGARRDSLMTRATQSYNTLVSEYPTTNEGTAARGFLSRRQAMSMSASEIAKNASTFSYDDLILAGVKAARASQYADAAALFEHALELNANSRDALYNGSLMYIDLKQFDRAIPLLRRLIAVDPSNADDYLLMANAYNGLAKSLGKSAGAKTANDSTLKYYTMSQNLPANLVVTTWTNREGQSTISGTVENRGTAAKAYTIVVEFLDKSGAVIGTQTATTPSVAPKATAPFSVTFTGANIVGYRYKAI